MEEPEDTPKPDGGEPDAEPDGYLKIDFEGLQAVNPDVIAWIDIPGLSISYPVVQGTDNAYYLHHLFTGEYNSSGSIFADWHNQPDFADPNTIVYGHNMKMEVCLELFPITRTRLCGRRTLIFTCMCRGRC